MKRAMNLKADVVGLLVKQMKREGLPAPANSNYQKQGHEWQFHPTRKWRFDLAYPYLKLAFEYEGGIFSGGAHTRGKHFQSDCEKYNTAALMGWRVFRLYGDMIFKGQREMDEGWKLIREALFHADTSNNAITKLDCFKEFCCADCSYILIDKGLEQVSEEDHKLYMDIVKNRK